MGSTSAKFPIFHVFLVAITILLTFLGSGCHLGYLLHAAVGQYRLLTQSIPVEEALKADSLNVEHKHRLRLVARIKDFGERELGLKETQNYQTVYLTSNQRPIYTISACPKDRLTRITWWFPVVGRMPYLGFFDEQQVKAEKEKLIKKDLDVVIGMADAYSTLGWFKDPVSLNLLEGTTVDLVETILHEMTHTTLYLKGQGEFNEGLAVLVGKIGAVLFLEKTFGISDPLTIQARRGVEDERLFSLFLTALLKELEHLYHSPMSYEEKLAEREIIFSNSLEEFGRLKHQLQTQCFSSFGSVQLNNAYLLSIGLYHRHFHLFEAVLKKNGNSVKKTLAFLQELAKQKGDILERIMRSSLLQNRMSDFNPDCTVENYCGLKILTATLVSRFCSSTYL